MKAIYINLDPYLAALAAWLKGGKSGPAPSFDPLPLAVTIPLGETACIYCPSGGEAETDPGDAPNEVTVDGQTLLFYQTKNDGIPTDAIAVKVAPGLSAIAPSAKYWVESVASDTSVTVQILDSDGDGYPVTIPVLVRRETASGPVDLVDFTPPASGTPSAADIKSALVAAGARALAGVQLGGAIIRATGRTDDNATMFVKESGEPGTETTFPLLAGEGVVDQIGGDGVS
jgi:hypothetical protein